MIARLLLLLALAVSLRAQKNLNFEEGSDGAPLQGWFAPSAIVDFKASWAANGCAQGNGCADLASTVPAPKSFGNIMQSFDAAPFRGKRIRYRAAVSTGGTAHAALWVRIDLVGGGIGFFENMQATPIRTQGQWKHFEIDGFVNADAKNVALGVMAFNGPIRFDDASFTVTGELPAIVTEGPRPVTAQGLRNLEAFATLYGLIRHFHPSDQVAGADWNLIAIEGARKTENAADLKKELLEIFLPVAPTLRVFTGEPPPLELPKTASLLRLQHKGFGQLGQRTNIYSTSRIPAQSLEYHAVSLGGEIVAVVPLAVYKDETGTLPRTAKPADALPPGAFDANDRATRLAAVIVAWNIFQHFYPYFDVTNTDWKSVLSPSLKQAAIDAGKIPFQSTLKRMVAALKDGHGNVYSSFGKPQAFAPLAGSWIENKYIVTLGNADVKPGDEIVTIDGKPAAARIAELEEEISTATPQWARTLSAALALSADAGSQLTLSIRPYRATETKEVTVICNKQSFPPLSDGRPTAITVELQPGIWYVDLTRAADKDFTDLLPQLQKAVGIVFDLRGYPRVSPAWFSHVSKTPLASAQWHVPLIDRPGHMEFTRAGEWNLQPKAPFLEAKKVFLTGGGAISYAESTMGIVEHYKLGEIIGEATAGTNGNTNPFQLPGGYNINWTGMKVVKHDGTRHHGVGIKPTIPMTRTQAGVAAGRDEVLDRAIASLKAQ